MLLHGRVLPAALELLAAGCFALMLSVSFLAGRSESARTMRPTHRSRLGFPGALASLGVSAIAAYNADYFFRHEKPGLALVECLAAALLAVVGFMLFKDMYHQGRI